MLRDGDVTTIDHPRAAHAPDLTGTRVVGIDDRGRIVGAPGRCDTAALGLNDRGQIVIAVAGTTDGTTCTPQ